MISKRIDPQMAILFFTNFIIFFIGMGVFSLLPVYATEFGAGSTMVGIYLAITYISISSGTMLAGALAERMRPKRLFIAAGILGVPALLLLGYATTLWHVIVGTAVTWFAGGVGLALVSIFTGLCTGSGKRGKSFGMMYLARYLAAVVGGLTVAQLMAWSGYRLMFTVLAVVWALWPLVAALGLSAGEICVVKTASGPGAPVRVGRGYFLLLLATLLSSTAVYSSRLGMSLSMKSLDFTPAAIAGTVVVGGLVMIPVTPLLGTLSDRLPRRRLLVASYGLTVVGALLLNTAVSLWHFYLAISLLFVATSANGSIAAALATDLLPPAALKRGLSWLNTMGWVAGIGGFAVGGYVLDVLGPGTLYVAAAATAVVAALALLSQRSRAATAEARAVGAQPEPVSR